VVVPASQGTPQQVLPSIELVGPLLPGAGGAMWGLPGNISGTSGVVEFDPSGEGHLTYPSATNSFGPKKSADIVDIELIVRAARDHRQRRDLVHVLHHGGGRAPGGGDPEEVAGAGGAA
jgi:hypothetical protein